MIYATLTFFALCAWILLCDAFGFPGEPGHHHVDCGIREMLVNTVPSTSKSLHPEDESANTGEQRVQPPVGRQQTTATAASRSQMHGVYAPTEHSQTACTAA